MAQKRRDLAESRGKAVVNCLPDEDGVNDSVTPEGMAAVHERVAQILKGRTLRSVIDPSRVVTFG